METVNDELKNIIQIEHSRHRSVENFATNALPAIAIYCFFPKKPSIAAERAVDRQPMCCPRPVPHCLPRPCTTRNESDY